MLVTKLVEFIAAICATFLNLVLIPIIYTKSSAKMGVYKYFLLAYTITACIYSYCVSTALFTWYLPKNGFLFICTVEIYPRWFGGLQLMLFALCYLGTIAILGFSFIYRLSILQSTHSAPWTIKHRYFPFAVVASAFPILGTAGCFAFLSPTDATESAYNDEVLLSLDVDLSHVYYAGGQFIIDGELQVVVIGFLGLCNVFFSLGIMVCVVCWFKIGRKLKELRRMTSSNYKFHYNFFTLLTLQTCLPLVFYALPITILIIMGFTQIQIDGFSFICSMALSFAQVLDPFLTIYFIRDYRRFILLRQRKLCAALGIKSRSVNVFTFDNSGSTTRPH